MTSRQAGRAYDSGDHNYEAVALDQTARLSCLCSHYGSADPGYWRFGRRARWERCVYTSPRVAQRRVQPNKGIATIVLLMPPRDVAPVVTNGSPTGDGRLGGESHHKAEKRAARLSATSLPAARSAERR
jgi:hypothetical protein